MLSQEQIVDMLEFSKGAIVLLLNRAGPIKANSVERLCHHVNALAAEVERLLAENNGLQAVCTALAERVAQSELLGKKAEKPAQASLPETEIAACGCQVMRGWRCQWHGQP